MQGGQMADNQTVIPNLKKRCTGCSLCVNICPKKAIHTENCEDGFSYPVIDESICVKCGLCHKECPLNYKETEKEQQFYIGYHADNEVQRNSSSGGIFWAISQHIISMGGVVYGASFTEDFTVKHDRAESEKELSKFQGSKYVQSDMEDIYEPLETDLKSGRLVLFSGTPCQVDAIKKYCVVKNISRDKLFLVDVLCHGAPSPDAWRQHFRKITRGKAIRRVTFRQKDSYGNGQNLLIEFENKRKKYFARSGQDSYYHLFLENVLLREGCFSCNYSSMDRASDISLGDLWNRNVDLDEFSEWPWGISEIIVNSEKGRILWDKIESSIKYREAMKEDVMQNALCKAPSRPALYNQFWQKYPRIGYEKTVWKLLGTKWKIKIIAARLGVQDVAYKMKHRKRNHE